MSEGRDASPEINLALTLVDWRRHVFSMYAEVRAASPEAGHALWRAGRDELFAGHAQSPLLEARKPTFTGLPVTPYDPAYRFLSPVLPADPDRRDVQTGTDGVVSFDRIGRVQVGDLGTLDVWEITGYGGGIFVPLRDGTAGTTSYGGGRYVLDTRKGADLGSDPSAALVIDLTFAYHPSCAYDPMWACPLAPPGNVLTAPVPVGEHLPPNGWY
jgi:uncharacterized protein (DUF1684 family)